MGQREGFTWNVNLNKTLRKVGGNSGRHLHVLVEGLKRRW